MKDFKDFLVPMMLGRVERSAAQAACALAESDGRVDVLVGLTAVSPLVAGWEYFPAGMYDTMDETARAAAEALAADARLAMVAEEAEHHVRLTGSFWLTPTEQTLSWVGSADLIVLGRPREPLEPDRRLFGMVLLGSGRPVLVMPDAKGRRPRFGRIVIAWKPCREAARAVHDAMPLLRGAQAIDVVCVEGMGDDAADRAEEAGADLVKHLGAHGVRAAYKRLPRGGLSAGDEILEFAQVAAADLIVAGGYGRARALEQIFGGVTGTLYEQSPIPVFFSH